MSDSVQELKNSIKPVKETKKTKAKRKTRKKKAVKKTKPKQIHAKSGPCPDCEKPKMECECPGMERCGGCKRLKAGCECGRPTVMTNETLQKLNEAFMLGCTDEEACIYANISMSTLYNYQQDNKWFLEKKNLLKQSTILQARREVIKGIKGNPDLALRYLERKAKKEFSPKIINEFQESEETKELMEKLNKVLDGGIVKKAEMEEKVVQIQGGEDHE